MLPFGVRAIDGHLPAGGLACAALHEIGGAGPEVEHGAAAALLIAGLLARTRGSVLWIMRQPDLFGPGLAGVGLDPDRVIFVEAGKSVLPVMEDGLRHRGLAGRGGRSVGATWPHRLAALAARGRGIGGDRLRAPPQPGLRRGGNRGAHRGADTLAHCQHAFTAAFGLFAGYPRSRAASLAARSAALPRRRAAFMACGGV